jgi:hypothetical protein
MSIASLALAGAEAVIVLMPGHLPSGAHGVVWLVLAALSLYEAGLYALSSIISD